MPGWMKHKLKSRLLGEISVTSDMQMTSPLWQKELKTLLIKVKEQSEKTGLKLNIQKLKIMASSLITWWQIDGETMETVMDFIFFIFQNHCGWGLQPWNWKTLALWKKSHDKPRQHIKKQRHHFAKGPYSQSYGFFSSHVWMWELDYKESWVLKDWCFWTVVLEKTLESPLDCKEIQPVHPKGNQSWIFIGRTDAVAEATVLWPPDVKSWLIREDPDFGKDWRQEEKGMTGWDGWMASLTQWTWVWASSRRWTWKPGVLQSMGLQRVGHDWTTKRQQ